MNDKLKQVFDKYEETLKNLKKDLHDAVPKDSKDGVLTDLLNVDLRSIYESIIKKLSEEYIDKEKIYQSIKKGSKDPEGFMYSSSFPSVTDVVRYLLNSNLSVIDVYTLAAINVVGELNYYHDTLMCKAYLEEMANDLQDTINSSEKDGDNLENKEDIQATAINLYNASFAGIVGKHYEDLRNDPDSKPGKRMVNWEIFLKLLEIIRMIPPGTMIKKAEQIFGSLNSRDRNSILDTLEDSNTNTSERYKEFLKNFEGLEDAVKPLNERFNEVFSDLPEELKEELKDLAPQGVVVELNNDPGNEELNLLKDFLEKNMDSPEEGLVVKGGDDKFKEFIKLIKSAKASMDKSKDNNKNI